MSEKAYCSAVGQLMIGIHNAFQMKDAMFPAFLLLYTSMDVVSSLSRPVAQADTSGDIFKKWIDDYMLPKSGLKCRSEDIWAARCGLLHTLSVSSKLSRQGQARELHYVDQAELVDPIQKKVDASETKHVIVSIPDYVLAFVNGLLAFSKKVASDPEIQTVAYHHARKLAVQETMPVKGIANP